VLAGGEEQRGDEHGGDRRADFGYIRHGSFRELGIGVFVNP